MRSRFLEKSQNSWGSHWASPRHEQRRRLSLSHWEFRNQERLTQSLQKPSENMGDSRCSRNLSFFGPGGTVSVLLHPNFLGNAPRSCWSPDRHTRSLQTCGKEEECLPSTWWWAPESVWEPRRKGRIYTPKGCKVSETITLSNPVGRKDIAGQWRNWPGLQNSMWLRIWSWPEKLNKFPITLIF